MRGALGDPNRFVRPFEFVRARLDRNPESVR
jgi:hypothetical protein